MAYFKNIHSLAELKKEYRRLALENHPDKGGSTEVM
jgi:curved DNA-binding protein CbpA